MRGRATSSTVGHTGESSGRWSSASLRFVQSFIGNRGKLPLPFGLAHPELPEFGVEDQRIHGIQEREDKPMESVLGTPSG